MQPWARLCRDLSQRRPTHSQPFVKLSRAYTCTQLSVCAAALVGGYLHNGSVLPDPLVERGGKLFKLLKLFLRLRIKERVAGWRLWDEDLDSEECWRVIYLGTRHTTGRHT